MITTQDITKLEKIFATKKELTDLRVEMGVGFFQVNEKIDILAENVLTMSEKIEHLSVGMDFLVGKYKNRELEDGIGSMVQARHTRQIEAIAEYVEIELPE